jgi:hypothetical protein
MRPLSTIGIVVFIGVIMLVSFALMGVLHPIEPVIHQKGDRLAAPFVAHPVRVIPIVEKPPAVDAPPALPPEKELLEADQPRDTIEPPARPHHNPCARWGGHKIVTHGGRYWHCRY